MAPETAVQKDKTEVIVDPEFEELLPRPSEEERANLEQSLLSEGCHDALKVWVDGEQPILLDGYNRLEICRKHEIPYNVVEVALEDRDAATVWIIEHQLGRRNLPAYVRAELALKLEPSLKEEAQERMLKGKTDPPQESSGGEVRDQLAKIAGVSHDTIRKVKAIAGGADEETKQKLRTGERTINGVFQKLKGRNTEPTSGGTSPSRSKRKTPQAPTQSKTSAALPSADSADSIAWVKGIADDSVDVLVATLPGRDEIDDIDEFLADFVPEAVRKVKPTGRAYFITSPDPDIVRTCREIRRWTQLLAWTGWDPSGGSAGPYQDDWKLVLLYQGSEAPPLHDEDGERPSAVLTGSVSDTITASSPDGVIEIDPRLRELVVGERVLTDQEALDPPEGRR